MKKTLVAIAALSIVGSAVAQVTISGGVSASYRSNAGTTEIGRTDGYVEFKSVENLGGGLTLTANGGLELPARDSGTDGRNLGLSIASATGGTLAYSSTLANNYSRLSMGGAVSLAADLDDLYGAAKESTAVKYTSPKLGNFTLDYGVSATSDILVAPTALNRSGLISTASLTDSGVAGVTYAAGPMTARVTYRNNDKRSQGDFTYDAKVAVLEAHVTSGYTSTSVLTDDTMTEVGIAIPMGAATIGAGYSSRGTTNGFAMGVSYALSKQTSIIGSYANLENKQSASANADGTQTQVKLMHKF